MEETHPEAAAVLRAAGWKPHDEWGVYTHGSLVMGSPRAGDFYVKNVARCAEGPDTPDDPVEAARWLVARFPVAPVSEPAQVFFYEAHSETGAEAEPLSESGAASGSADEGWSGRDNASGDGSDLPAADEVGGPVYGDADIQEASSDFEGGGGETLALDLGAEILDADFTEPTDPPPEDHPSGAFIFGDNLEQKRTAAIGLVVQEALTRLPAAIDYSRMSELRNFTMGVSEGRWPDDPAKREELDLLEATERLRRAIEAIRDAKIETLLTATREEIEAFDTGAGWP